MQVRPLYKAQIAKGPDFLCFHLLCIGFDSLKPKTKTQLRFGPHPQIRLHNPVGWGGEGKIENAERLSRFISMARSLQCTIY
ncbi:hypothetical protein HanIR_Chr04g0160941 [Helianthus annuus]|nr:hypothetical protein HanIR_Chr04g0160941 [Helianthus annuus]